MPPILADLPKGSLDGQTTHYAEGPAGYVGGGGVLPPELVGFDRGAETATANYSLNSGPATLTIIDYPTPQMAEAQEPRIRAYIKAGSAAQPPWPKALVDSDQASLEVRRSGPLVAIVSGNAIPDESHKLIEMVHYRGRPHLNPAARGRVGDSKDGQAVGGDCRNCGRWRKCGAFAGFFPWRGQGVVPHHARQAGFLSLGRRVYPN